MISHVMKLLGIFKPGFEGVDKSSYAVWSENNHTNTIQHWKLINNLIGAKVLVNSSYMAKRVI